VIVVPLNMEKSEDVARATRTLHDRLCSAGFDVLVDDRPQRAGAKFADADLIGVPHRVVISDRGLGDGNVEYKARRDAEPEPVGLEQIVEHLVARRAG
jgi:prolyl-tRNA synthetase